MRLALLLVVLALWAAPARADDAINTLIGDASWAERAGDPADEVTRVRAHLVFVHALLATRDTSALAPAQRRARAASLVDLERYIARGEFPQRTDDAYAGRRPRFIDDRGVHCAVGQLIADSGAPELASAINARFEYAHVREMDDARLVAWAGEHGFTVDELAMIQPGYSPPPTESSTRSAILYAQEAITVRCARHYAPMSKLLVFVAGNDDGDIVVTTKSPEPFAKCFVRSASGRGGGAYSPQPERFWFGMTVTFTPPQKSFEKALASWWPSSCWPMRGALARKATIALTSTREALTAKVTTTPQNDDVARCIEKRASTDFTQFGRGAWQLHASRTIDLAPNVVLREDSLRNHASQSATTCMPEPAPGTKTTVAVTAKIDDPGFAITVSGSADFKMCMVAALQKQLELQFRSGREVSPGKWEPFMRIDADVNTSVTIEIESKAAQTKRYEEIQNEMDRERQRHLY